MEGYTPELTIITPTYNRAKTISSCWESLKRQSNNNFQWLIIDDGSNDGTKQLVDGFIKSTPDMRIEYVFKENGGKHTALNLSHEYIKGKYVLILDSDDMLTMDAVETVLDTWEKYNGASEVNVIYFYRKNTNGETLCHVKNENKIICTYRERRMSKLKSRDCCDTFRTDAFVKFNFPVFEGEKFIGEGAAFLNIELMGKGVYIDRAIYVCDYLDGGLTRQGRKMRLLSPRGGRFNANVYMNEHLYLTTRIKNALLYVCYSYFAGVSLKKMFCDTKHKALLTINLLPGTLLYFYWRKKFFGNES